MNIVDELKKYLDSKDTMEITFTLKEMGVSMMDILEALDELNNLVIREGNISYKYMQSYEHIGETFTVILNKKGEPNDGEEREI